VILLLALQLLLLVAVAVAVAVAVVVVFLGSKEDSSAWSVADVEVIRMVFIQTSND
jgi:hypothetical protein